MCPEAVVGGLLMPAEVLPHLPPVRSVILDAIPVGGSGLSHAGYQWGDEGKGTSGAGPFPLKGGSRFDGFF